MRYLAFFFALALWVCPLAADEPTTTTLGVGTDLAGDQTCLGCHGPIATAWNQLSSHSLLFDCATCHKALKDTPGEGHRDKPACATCHSETAHPTGATCATCHTTHGSANAFLILDSITTPAGTTPAIHVTKPEGASKDGLVRQGVSGETAGTGLCEVCHDATTHYSKAGTATAHDTTWCGACHDHQNGFAPPATPRTGR